MSEVPAAKTVVPAPLVGGIFLTWLLGDEPRTITTKTGDKRTVVEFRDPQRLSQSLVLWLDGEADSLPTLAPGAPVKLHVQSVRSGRARGELVGDMSHAALSASFARAAGEQS